ncbi:glutathione-disulfide reductase [Gregarina niphandrodes]|uniref:Glutathione-disulfide reductase n=1 Tax=Gregarina niphandrodes TaxID=110365 RepID=A0A023AXZ7_GRENI|nr:glutathione-disulfide reductase [Gregarina niphandrodes]EZG43160.1 glutathione-disulfide reductase [Gregarina niphandrodes]|eukprot:XP_011133582.1 glutathione-disulfide reductase [Gregarina niphandrodes]
MNSTQTKADDSTETYPQSTDLARYDLVVIGAGSGGVACAKRASSHGARVAVVEAGAFGGTCVNVGCVPKKIMWWASQAREFLQEAHHYGLTPSAQDTCANTCANTCADKCADTCADTCVDKCAPAGGLAAPAVDWAYLKSRRDASVQRLNGIYEQQLRAHGIDIYRGTASIETAGDAPLVGDAEAPASALKSSALKSSARWVVRVKGKATTGGVPEVRLCAERVVVAVGSRSKKLGVPGEATVAVGSDGFFALERRPEKVAVVGAGYIAVEFAGVLTGLGCETHLFLRHEKVLRSFDEMLSTKCTEFLERQGCHLHRGAQVEEFIVDANGKQIRLKDGRTFDHFDSIIVAIGREPNTDALGLDALNVRCDSAGHIQVDDFQNVCFGQDNHAKDNHAKDDHAKDDHATNVSDVGPAVGADTGLYALGDVIGRVELTPMAIAAGRRLADRLYLEGFEAAKVAYEDVPTVVFSHPPIGTVGLSEAQARERFGNDDVLVYTNTAVNLYYNVFDVIPTEKPKTYIKLVCVKHLHEQVVGIHVIGMGADEIIQGFGLALKLHATKNDLDNVVAVHPSAAEEIVTCAPWGLPHPDNDLRRIQSKFHDEEIANKDSSTTTTWP